MRGLNGWVWVGLILTACGGGGSSNGGSNSGVPPATSPNPGTSLESRLDALVAPHVDSQGAPGKSVGLVVGAVVAGAPGVRVVRGWGATTLGGVTVPNNKTVFELGSVTKTYTGVMFGLMLKRGDLSAGQVLSPWFVDGVPSFTAPSGAISPIRLMHLATHTAALPPMPTNLLYPSSPNPAQGYTVDHLKVYMATAPALPRVPGSGYVYSNLGSGTLAHILIQRAGLSNYEALVKREIADRLGLVDTVIELNADQQFRRAQGYLRSSGLSPAPANDIGEGLQGAGALRATADDVLAFVVGALGQGNAELVAAWSEAMTPRVPFGEGVNPRTGLLLNIEDLGGRTVYSKSGLTAGFSAQIMFTTSPPAAVVLLSNTANTDLKGLGAQVLDELLK